MSTLLEAVKAWRKALGPNYVTEDRSSLELAATATFTSSARVLAVLHPADRAQVQDCLRIANRFRVPVYPVSSGKNWGYGSSAPVQDGVLLNLARLNRIVDFNEELAYATVEPGVTQDQLHTFLRERGSRLWMDATGASPHCSIIGNTLERGFGHTPLGDHFAHACGFEVVLPTGEVIETGFGRFPGSSVSALNRAGVGPSIDGLFAQSNFGVITRMTVWLMPAPEHFEAFFFVARRSDAIAEIVEALRPLRLDGTLRSMVHVGNDYKVLAGIRQYPWQETGGRTPLDVETMARLRQSLRIGCWNGSGGLYGTYKQVREAKRRVRRALRGKVDRLQFVNDRRLKLLKRFAGPAGWLIGWDVERTLAMLDSVYHLMKGVPTEVPLASMYWRKKMPVPAKPDPNRDGCGLLWCSPVLPSTGADALRVAELGASILLEHGFDPQMSLTLTAERSSTVVITVSYDRHIPGEDARALECYRTLASVLISEGYPPYRLNTRGMDLVNQQPEYDATLQQLQRALDPRAILAPGRYQVTEPLADVAGRQGVA